MNDLPDFNDYYDPTLFDYRWRPRMASQRGTFWMIPYYLQNQGVRTVMSRSLEAATKTARRSIARYKGFAGPDTYGDELGWWPLAIRVEMVRPTVEVQRRIFARTRDAVIGFLELTLMDKLHVYIRYHGEPPPGFTPCEHLIDPGIERMGLDFRFNLDHTDLPGVIWEGLDFKVGPRLNQWNCTCHEGYRFGGTVWEKRKALLEMAPLHLPHHLSNRGEVARKPGPFTFWEDPELPVVEGDDLKVMYYEREAEVFRRTLPPVLTAEEAQVEKCGLPFDGTRSTNYNLYGTGAPERFFYRVLDKVPLPELTALHPRVYERRPEVVAEKAQKTHQHSKDKIDRAAAGRAWTAKLFEVFQNR